MQSRVILFAVVILAMFVIFSQARSAYNNQYKRNNRLSLREFLDIFNEEDQFVINSYLM